MKKTMVYILALSMAFSALLAGCGENKTRRPDAAPTATPALTIQPTATPDLKDDPGKGLENDVKNSVKKAEDKLTNESKTDKR